MSHIITNQDLHDIRDYRPEAIMFAEHGNGTNKKLLCVTDPINKRVSYKVQNQKHNIYEGPDLHIAIDIYNTV